PSPRAEPHAHQARGQKLVEGGEEVGVERGLVEGSAAEPVPASDLARPAIVEVGVSYQDEGDVGVPELPEIDEPDQESPEEDDQETAGELPVPGPCVRRGAPARGPAVGPRIRSAAHRAAATGRIPRVTATRLGTAPQRRPRGPAARE